MVEDIDAALQRLSAAPPHPGLVSIEGTVLGRLRERPAAISRQGFGIGATAAFAALLLGIATGSPRASATPNTLSPFGPSSPLAPSTLLTAGR